MEPKYTEAENNGFNLQFKCPFKISALHWSSIQLLKGFRLKKMILDVKLHTWNKIKGFCRSLNCINTR